MTRKAHAGNPLMLSVIVVVGSLLIQLLALALYRWRNSWRYRKQVVATMNQIQIWLDGWDMSAMWRDALTGQSYTFYSNRIEDSFDQRVGDSVIVDVDPNNFERYRTSL